MKLKSVKKIRDEWCDSKDGKISKESLNDLKKHLERNDTDNLCEAMSLVTDARIMTFVPLMAKNLTNEWSIVREFAIGKLLGILKLPEYAEIGLKMAQEDESAGVRSLALFNIGTVFDLLSEELRKKIAAYLIKVFYDEGERNTLRHSAYTSILIDMGVHLLDRPSAARDLRIPAEVNWEIIQKFKEKYGL